MAANGVTSTVLTNSNSYRASLNKLWASLMLEELTRLGVEHICIAPGSRSTPLTLAASNNPKLTIHTHFDERGLGFMALGIAKASQKPVAVVVTSGTAVANLLPAVAESGLTGEKLVMLTSDRPAELIQCGANQAIRQHGIFSSHATAFIDIPSPTLDISPSWLLAAIDDLMQQQAQRGGTVHFNCHYPEPLYGQDFDFTEYLSPVAHWQNHELAYCQHLSSIHADFVQSQTEWSQFISKKGVIVVGRVLPNELTSIKALATTLGWPILVDPQAGGSSEWAGFDVWMQNPAALDVLSQAQVLLQFGGRIVSKRLLQWIGQQPWQAYWLLDPLAGRLDQWHLSAQRIQTDCGQWAQDAKQMVQSSPQADWALSLQTAASNTARLVASETTELSELALATHIHHWLPTGTELFLGNSLIVRLLDMVGTLPETATFANRGASGIDGLIATAAGVQKARQTPMVCLIGDTSLLYDLNSLALLTQAQQPMVVIVTNNNGGGIFDLLPVPDQQKDDFYRMPHGLSFAHAAAMFGLNYQCPSSIEELACAVRDGLSKITPQEAHQATSQTTVIEVVTPSGEAGDMLKALFAKVKNASLF